ncbi:hypothetical protein CUS_7075 [Ruminococcus albus 8]|uniref:Uncharacterized protein n=1 Tax=Ruminococcus albus 8 TaxID=246199 RepID=E9SHX1_RUMAL|nr:hypothetical protein CUS_7075 [Ruminococcus albus 8]
MLKDDYVENRAFVTFLWFGCAVFSDLSLVRRKNYIITY